MKNDEKYFFDKRQRKRSIIKYLIIFGIGFVPVVLFNIYVGHNMKQGLVIFLDCVFLLIIAIIGNIIANKIFEKKDDKLDKKRKEREELNKRKQEILEASYKAKRDKKKQEKNNVKATNENDT